MPSFDIVSEVENTEVKNAVEQTNKEVSTRFDFKGSDARVEQAELVLTVHADKGRYDNKASKLFLTGGVTAYHESGYEIHLQDISVDIATRAAASLLPVTAQGPVGELRAQNIAVTDQGMLVVFGGPAQMTLHRLKAKRARSS